MVLILSKIAFFLENNLIHFIQIKLMKINMKYYECDTLYRMKIENAERGGKRYKPRPRKNPNAK